MQDAATVYAEVLRRYSHSPDPSHSTESVLTVDKDDADDTHASIRYHNKHEKPCAASASASSFPFPSSKGCKIVLIGDSAGGNLVLALARWIRDENVLPPPDGLLLLSPSCDPGTLPTICIMPWR